jgi:two-component system chemotaxis response regulator CheB
MICAYDIVVVGASLGGSAALQEVLEGLPEGFCLPIAVVQHRGADGSGPLVALLERSSRLPVAEAEDKQALTGGRVYVAPSDYHLLVEQGAFALSTDPPVVSARPSIDVLFETAADAYHARVIAVVLTGASEDGARGAQRVKEHGGVVLVQDPATAESPVLPRAVIAACPVDRIVPLSQMAPLLEGLARLEAGDPER